GPAVYAFDLADRKKLWDYNLSGRSSGGVNVNLTTVDAEGGVRVTNQQDGTVQRLGQVAAVQPTYVCILSRAGLIAVDPFKGPEEGLLWRKTDVRPNVQVFGDAEYVYLVELGTDGTPSTTRAVRASDGVSVPVPGFAELYDPKKRLRTLGRQLLVFDENAM